MTGSTAAVQIGTRIHRDGCLWTVVELSAGKVLLRSATSVVSVSVAELIDDPDTGFVDVQPVPGGECGAAIDTLTSAQRGAWIDRVGHVHEVLTGYRSGDPTNPRPGEPRIPYANDSDMASRYRAKAGELKVSPKTISRWVQLYQREGAGALIDGRSRRTGSVLDAFDRRWIDMCRTVCADCSFDPRYTKKHVLMTVRERLNAEFGPGVVPIPGRTAAYRALDEITKGTNMFSGSAKGKREIATRPKGAFGHFEATRLGEYVILDTTTTDVYAMQNVSYEWVNTELTIAMDLYGRIVCGLRLSPVSTQSMAVASVLYEVICPPRDVDAEPLPYIGFPENVLLAVDAGPDGAGAAIPIECVVVDHGRVYMSEHIRTVLERFGISVQPARPYRGSDKGPLERWFRTLREGLLEHLEGYKGPDLYSRGKDAEAGAFYFVDELEAIIREWVRDVYHQRPHGGLVVPTIPGLELSPADMYELGIATTGFRRIPTSRDAVYDFLPVAWGKIQHYGIDFNKLKYNGPALDDLRNTTSPYRGRHAGKYPIRYDPGDLRCVYIQHPDDDSWHQVPWVYADSITTPFSLDALRAARALAVRRGADQYPDDELALSELLARWSRSEMTGRRERKAAIQLSGDYASQLRRDLDNRDALVEPTPATAPPAGTPIEEDYPDIGVDEEGDDAVNADEYYLDAMDPLA